MAPATASPRDPSLSEASCALCAADVIHCHDVSVEHADGSTACADPWCNIPHHLHEWRLTCDELEPPCPCAGDPAGAVPWAA
ncbi:MAG TPA: hypothetical protein VF183_02995 [Acidimicrobiales bacterium]